MALSIFTKRVCWIAFLLVATTFVFEVDGADLPSETRLTVKDQDNGGVIDLKGSAAAAVAEAAEAEAAAMKTDAGKMFDSLTREKKTVSQGHLLKVVRKNSEIAKNLGYMKDDKFVDLRQNGKGNQQEGEDSQMQKVIQFFGLINEKVDDDKDITRKKFIDAVVNGKICIYDHCISRQCNQGDCTLKYPLLKSPLRKCELSSPYDECGAAFCCTVNFEKEWEKLYRNDVEINKHELVDMCQVEINRRRFFDENIHLRFDLQKKVNIARSFVKLQRKIIVEESKSVDLKLQESILYCNTIKNYIKREVVLNVTRAEELHALAAKETAESESSYLDGRGEAEEVTKSAFLATTEELRKAAAAALSQYSAFLREQETERETYITARKEENKEFLKSEKQKMEDQKAKKITAIVQTVEEFKKDLIERRDKRDKALAHWCQSFKSKIYDDEERLPRDAFEKGLDAAIEKGLYGKDDNSVSFDLVGSYRDHVNENGITEEFSCPTADELKGYEEAETLADMEAVSFVMLKLNQQKFELQLENFKVETGTKIFEAKTKQQHEEENALNEAVFAKIFKLPNVQWPPGMEEEMDSREFITRYDDITSAVETIFTKYEIFLQESMKEFDVDWALTGFLNAKQELARLEKSESDNIGKESVSLSKSMLEKDQQDLREIQGEYERRKQVEIGIATEDSARRDVALQQAMTDNIRLRDNMFQAAEAQRTSKKEATKNNLQRGLDEITSRQTKSYTKLISCYPKEEHLEKEAGEWLTTDMRIGEAFRQAQTQYNEDLSTSSGLKNNDVYSLNDKKIELSLKEVLFGQSLRKFISSINLKIIDNQAANVAQEYKKSLDTLSEDISTTIPTEYKSKPNLVTHDDEKASEWKDMGEMEKNCKLGKGHTMGSDEPSCDSCCGLEEENCDLKNECNLAKECNLGTHNDCKECPEKVGSKDLKWTCENEKEKITLRLENENKERKETLGLEDSTQLEIMRTLAELEEAVRHHL